MVGTVQSGQHTTSTGDSGTIWCTYVKSGIFAVGAVLAIPSVICGIIYYILASEVKNSIKEGSTQNQNIAMAQPYSGNHILDSRSIPIFWLALVAVTFG